MNSIQPNSSMCFVCGLENQCGLGLKFYNAGPDEVTATYTVPDHYQGYPGVVHGGIVAAMLDEAAGRTSLISDPQHFMTTVKMEIKYRRPVPVGQPLRIVGKVLRRKGRLVFAHAEIRLADDAIAAEADVLLADAPVETFGVAVQDLERLGWKVYPDR